MLRRLLAISAIFIGTTAAWLFLGVTISTRTGESDAQLRDKVSSVWGGRHAQVAPIASFGADRISAPAASDIEVVLNLEHRRKGLLWYPTYTVDFQGKYGFRNEDAEARDVQFYWAFPAKGAIYDDLQLTLDGAALRPELLADRARVTSKLQPGQTVRLGVRYKSQGLEEWRYRFGAQISSLPNFRMRVKTNFGDVDFDDRTLAPTTKMESGTGWELTWAYRNLFAGREIAVVMPQKPQPGPLAAEISFFAPVSLLFYFFVLLMFTSLKEVDLHPMNYFFLACSFFAFHLLMAYLVDHIDIYAAFAISAAVSVFLAVTYLRLVAGAKFAMREAAGAQLVYLVLFSFAFFFRGFTGLAVTVGAILTLFLTMQLTAGVRWADRFDVRPNTSASKD